MFGNMSNKKIGICFITGIGETMCARVAIKCSTHNSQLGSPDAIQ